MQMHERHFLSFYFYKFYFFLINYYLQTIIQNFVFLF